MNKFLKLGINIGLSILVLVLGYWLYDEIFSPYFFTKAKDMRYAKTHERMDDIILAQDAYKEVTGVYASDFDTLIQVLKTDSVMQIKSFGEEGDTVLVISVNEAIKLFDIDPDLPKDKLISMISKSVNAYNDQLKNAGGDLITTYKVEDTVYIPAIETLELKHTTIDSLKYIPFSDGKTFEMESGILEIGLGRVKVAVFEVTAYNRDILKGLDERFYRKDEGLILGSLTEASTDIEPIKFD
jgi:hypothetical protein